HFLWMILEKIEHVRRMRCCNDLDGFAAFSVLLWIGQPVHTVTDIPKETWVDTMIRVFKANNRWGIWKICQRKERQGKKSSMREISSPTRILIPAGSECESAHPYIWSLKKYAVKFRKTATHFLIQGLKSLRRSISKII